MFLDRIRKLFPLLALAALTACADIDRALYSASDSVAPVDRVTGQRSLSFAGREAQIAKSNAEADQMLKQYITAGKPLDGKVNAAQYNRLQQVFRRVHAVSHLKDETWTAYLLPSAEWNAFTMGGTYIFVNKGLMDDIRSDDELAAVIGHEIAHVAANHVYEQQSYTLAASLKGSKSVGKQSFQSAFTLKNEEEADEIGTLYATLAGYDPYAAARVWKRMYDSRGDFSAMTIDHPVNSARFARTEELAKIYSQYYTPGQVNPRHAEILASNPVFGSGGSVPQMQPGQGGGLMAVLETAADALSKHTQAKTEQGRQQANQQFIQYVRQSVSAAPPQVVDAHTLRVAIAYRGQQPVKNLNLVAMAGDEEANRHSGDQVIAPMSNFVVEFKFSKTDLTAIDPQSIRLGVTHAEQP